MSEPLVSVVMPVRDGQEFLNTAIDSILRQVYKKFELLIVDYGSTDETATIIANYTDPRISYLRTTETKLELALNLGIKKATGDYVARMDQADVSSPYRLQKQVDFLVNNPDVGLVGVNFDVIEENGNLIDRQAKLNKSEDLSPRWLIENPFAHGSVMFRRTAILEIGGYKPTEALETYKLWFRMSAKYKLGLLPQLLYQTRVVPGRQVRGSAIKLDKSLTGLSCGDIYELWVRLAGGNGAGEKISTEKLINHGGRTGLRVMIQSIEEISRAAQYAWKNPNLTNTQRWVLEEQLDAFHTQWAELKNQVETPPDISVVMSLYNSEKDLVSAVNSILGQTFRNFEFIIIDDGSVDRSVEIIEAFTDPRIRLVCQTNHGLNYSLNKGARLARAPLIARMDPDDISLPSRFEKQIIMLSAQPNVGLVSTFFTHMEDATEEKGVTLAFPFKSLDVKRSFYMVNSIAHGSAMFRKAIWEAVGGFDPKYQPPDDFHFWTKIAGVADIAIIPESLYWYRVNPKGMTATMSGLAEMADIITNEYWLQGYKAKGVRAILKDANYYRDLDNPHAQFIYEQYVAQQLHIARGLIARLYIRSAVKMIVAVVVLDRSFKRRHMRLVLGLCKSVAKKILRRPRSIGNTLN